MHDFALENLHSMHNLVEFGLVLYDKLLLDIHIGGVLWHSHPNPVVLHLDNIVDALDSHQKAEHR